GASDPLPAFAGPLSFLLVSLAVVGHVVLPFLTLGKCSASHRIEFTVQNHGLRYATGFAEGFRRADIGACRVGHDVLHFFVEKPGDEFGGVFYGPPVLVHDVHSLAVAHALGDHQPVNAVGCQVLHVAVQQAGAFAIEHAIAVADNGANRRPSAGQGSAAHTPGHRPK